MVQSERLELRVSPELLARLDERRGDTPRAAWVKRALEQALGDSAQASEAGIGRESVVSDVTRSASGPAPARGSVEPTVKCPVKTCDWVGLGGDHCARHWQQPMVAIKR